VPDARRWHIEPIRKDHPRSGFDCGVAELDEFLRRYARQGERLEISRTYVAVEEGSGKVLGYYTLRSGAVDFEDLPPEEAKRLPHYPVPVVHLARLAVDRRSQGRGVGEDLLVDALARAVQAADTIGAFAVEVIAKSEAAVSYYRSYGFLMLARGERRLYLPMKTARAALAVLRPPP